MTIIVIESEFNSNLIENLSSISEKLLKSSKIEIFSWLSRLYGQLQGLGSNVFLWHLG
jgi:hypothetical protein